MMGSFTYNSLFRGNWHWIVITSILGAIVGVTLVAGNLFIYSSLTPFYLYLIAISLFMVVVGAILIFKPVSIYFTWPILIILVWILYIVLNGLLGNNFNPFHIYLIVSLLFLIALFFATQVKVFKSTLLYQIITFIAGFEALFCIGQFIHIFHTLNSYFTVTGSWENPNVTAMFLAMAMPAMVQLAIKKSNIIQYIAIGSIGFSIIAIALLECRTALIGVVVAVFIVLNDRFKIVQWLSNKRNRSASIVIILLCFSLLIPIAGYFYNAKKASADGRKLIWKLSTEMIAEHPVTGYGYGLFEKNYNLYQSQYFKAGKGSDEEIQQAGFVHMGYNEFLENTVEGGLLGVLLFGGLFLLLLWVPGSYKADNTISQSNQKSADKNEPQNDFIVAYAGIAEFAVMSLCNFALQAIPAMCLFVIYGGIIATHPAFTRFFFYRSSNYKLLNLRYYVPVGITIVFIGLFLFYVSVSAANSSMLNKKAALQAKRGDTRLAIETLTPLFINLSGYESYWRNYATVLMSERDYKNAVSLFNKAKKYTSDPDVYLKAAKCYLILGDNKNAENDLLTAKYIAPSRLAPRVALMDMYWKENDTTEAITEAREILNQKIKIRTKEANYDKYQATVLIRKLGLPINQQQMQTNKQLTIKTPVFLHKSI